MIRKIVRQRDPELRAAVKDISLGEISTGFEKLDALGCIHESAGDERHGQLAQDYLDAVNEQKEVLVVAPTHREGHEVAKLVRAGLKKAGQLGNDRQVIWLEQVAMTAEQRGDAVNYKPGMVIEFHQKAAGKKLAGFQLAMDKKGETFEPVPFPPRKKRRGRPSFQGYQQRAIQRGSRLEVIGRDEEGHVYAKNAEGGVCLVPIWDSGKFSVHERELMPLTAGVGLPRFGRHSG